MTTLSFGTSGDTREVAIANVPRGSNLTDWFTETLLSTIDQDDLPAGTKLPTEQALCDALNVSRTVVREAISRLKAEGRLTSKRGSGIFVAHPSHSAQPFLRTPGNLVEVLNLLELRLAVEVEAASLAATRVNGASLVALDESMQQFEDAVAGLQLSSDADLKFHRAVASATGNPMFSDFLDNIGATAIPRRSLDAQFTDVDARKAYLRRLADEHAAIHSAIVNRQPEAAASAMRSHLDGSRLRYRKWAVSTATGLIPE